MANNKHIRTTEYQYDWAETWLKWCHENSVKDVGVYGYTDGRKKAKALGITDVEQQDAWVDEQRARYFDYREQFDKEMFSVKLDKEQQLLIRNNQLDSAISVYQRADRILTNLPVSVFLNDDPDQSTPAYNDGKNITFNAKFIKELNDETVESLHGLNYHELAHLLFTPRIGTDLGKWVTEKKPNTESMREPKRLQAFNILEDCRAEYYLTLKYPSVRPFLIATLGEYLAENAEHLTENFLVLAGRKYFSLGARTLSGMLYANAYGMEQAGLVYRISAEYRTLVFPRDYARAKELITEMVAILKTMPHLEPMPNGCSHRPIMRNGKPATEREQDNLISGDTQKDDLDLSSGGRGTESGDDKGIINPDTADFSDKLNAELLEQIEKSVKDAKSDPELRKKVTDTVKAISRDNSTKTILGKQPSNVYPPSQAEITASRLFGQELERLRIESDPAWNLEKPTGKLNVRRAMNADVNDINKLFDRWEIGNDDYDIESCVLIDRSGSMNNIIGSACRSAWVIKRGIEKINGKVSVLTFNTISKTVYSRDDKATAGQVRIVEPNGGTDPYYALMETERVMTQSNAKTKLVFLVTDGNFDGHSDDIIQRLKRSGVYVSVVYLDEHGWADKADPEQLAKLAHDAHDFRAIANPKDLVKVAKDVVRANTRGVLAK